MPTVYWSDFGREDFGAQAGLSEYFCILRFLATLSACLESSKAFQPYLVDSYLQRWLVQHQVSVYFSNKVNSVLFTARGIQDTT